MKYRLKVTAPGATREQAESLREQIEELLDRPFRIQEDPELGDESLSVATDPEGEPIESDESQLTRLHALLDRVAQQIGLFMDAEYVTGDGHWFTDHGEVPEFFQAGGPSGSAMH